MNIVKIFSANKKYISDYIYSMGSMLILQVVLQLIIYPLINHWHGEETLGSIVYYMSVVYIIAQTVGYSLSQTRLVVRKEYETTNGDYNLISVILVLISTLLGAVIVSNRLNTPELIGYSLILAITTYRFYCTVEYRLKLNFKICLIFFIIISLGYLVGTVLYFITEQWYLIFITGELAGVLYIVLKGSIFKPEKRSQNTKKLTFAVLTLCASSAITYTIENLDRIILLNFIDARAVSIYYAVSLIGKTLLMFVAPINTITLSYVSANNRSQTRTEFLSACKIYIVIGIGFYLMCLIGTPIFTKLFYPNLYPQMHGLNVIVNAAQIIGLVSSLPMVLILNSLGSKYHLGIHLVYAATYVPLSMILTNNLGIVGYAWASLISNTVKLVIVILSGIIKMQKRSVNYEFKK